MKCNNSSQLVRSYLKIPHEIWQQLMADSVLPKMSLRKCDSSALSIQSYLKSSRRESNGSRRCVGRSWAAAVPQPPPTEAGLSCRCRSAARNTTAALASPVSITRPPQRQRHDNTLRPQPQHTMTSTTTSRQQCLPFLADSLPLTHNNFDCMGFSCYNATILKKQNLKNQMLTKKLQTLNFYF